DRGDRHETEDLHAGSLPTDRPATRNGLNPAADRGSHRWFGRRFVGKGPMMAETDPPESERGPKRRRPAPTRPRSIVRTSATVLLSAVTAALLTGCGGNHHILDSKGPEA